MAGDGEWSQFRALREDTVPAYIQDHGDLAERLGGAPSEWDVTEVGDGNINFVYVVKGPKGSLVLKQALPYIRCVGESWPMTLERINFEAKALQQEFKLAPEHVPEVFLHDPVMAAIAMEYLSPPHIILRKGLIQALPYPSLAQHMSSFLATTLFGTSLLANGTDTVKLKVAEFCRNVEMCRLTEQVIFTEPYFKAANNHWTSPQLDEEVKGIWQDAELKLEVAALKKRFCEKTEALIHGDLHTGSIMATQNSTKVIDPEFAFYGPMGFDVGAFLGNLLLSYYSQDGHSTQEQPREEYKRWILKTFEETWVLFETKFKGLWNASVETALKKQEQEKQANDSLPSVTAASFTAGDAFSISVFNTPQLVASAQDLYLKELLADSLGFAGAKMIRRIVGIAHVEDLESIADPTVRASCEKRALRMGRALVKQRGSFSTIQEVAALAEAQ